MPKDLATEIKKTYHTLCVRMIDLLQLGHLQPQKISDTSLQSKKLILNVKGFEDVVKHVQMCWHLFRITGYLLSADKGFNHMKN